MNEAHYFVALLLEGLRDDYAQYAKDLLPEEFEYAAHMFEKNRVPVKLWRFYVQAVIAYSNCYGGYDLRSRLVRVKNSAGDLASFLAHFDQAVPILKKKGWPTDINAYNPDPKIKDERHTARELWRVITDMHRDKQQAGWKKEQLGRDTQVLLDDERWYIVAPKTQEAANAFAYRYGAVPGKWCVAKTGDPDNHWGLYTGHLGARFVFIYDKQAKLKWAVTRYDDRRVAGFKQMYMTQASDMSPEQRKEVEAEWKRLGGWEVYDKDDKRVELKELSAYMGSPFAQVERYLNDAPLLAPGSNYNDSKAAKLPKCDTKAVNMLANKMHGAFSVHGSAEAAFTDYAIGAKSIPVRLAISKSNAHSRVRVTGFDGKEYRHYEVTSTTSDIADAIVHILDDFGLISVDSYSFYR